MISVCMITYNHEKFINKAIDGVLMQQTTFPFELIIGEDNSTDKTRKICQEYVAKFPAKVKLLPSEFNVGMKKNFIRTLKNCKKKYVAYCEGDDFWTDKKKLQKQVEFLENNSEYVLSHHKDEILLEREVGYTVYDERVRDATTTDVIKAHFISTLSIVFRNVLAEEDFLLIEKAGSPDIAAELLLSLHGKFYFFKEEMGVYRMHEGGVTASYSGTIKRHLENIRFYCKFNELTHKKYQQDLQKKVVKTLADVNAIWFTKSIRQKIKKKLWLAVFILSNYPANFFVKARLSVKFLLSENILSGNR